MDTNQIPTKHSPLSDEEIALIIEWVSKKEPTNRIIHRLNRNLSLQQILTIILEKVNELEFKTQQFKPQANLYQEKITFWS
jgi:hypothetical protein